MGEYVDTMWEIYLERARYLLNIDELLEEMHSKTKSEITDNMKVEFCWNAGTVCCGALVDTDESREV
jgi:Tfp pilus assembly protein PilV